MLHLYSRYLAAAISVVLLIAAALVAVWRAA